VALVCLVIGQHRADARLNESERTNIDVNKGKRSKLLVQILKFVALMVAFLFSGGTTGEDLLMNELVLHIDLAASPLNRL